MNRLLRIGFQKAGYWKLVNDSLVFVLTLLEDKKNILYAFVSEGKIKYIGKSVQYLKARMNGYKNPGPTQNTNIKNNKKIKEILKNGKNVEIFAFADNGLLQYGGFHINLAAGLEDSLISNISPEWNEEHLNTATHFYTDSPHEVINDTNNTVLKKKSTDKSPVFKLTLQKTYYNNGFFNVTVDFECYFGKDGENIYLNLDKIDEVINGKIDRKANTNETPRIQGGKMLKKWFQDNFEIMDTVYITILSPNAVKIRKCIS